MNKINYPISDPHSLNIDALIQDLDTDIRNGLTEQESMERNEMLGLNSYKFQKQKSILLIALEQFKNPIVYLLVAGASVSFYFKDYTEGFAILAVIFLNAAIGFFMELQARRSMNALRSMDVTFSKVVRDGKLQEIPSEKITAGELIYFEAGDVITGDGRILEANQLQCDESSLTGESMPVDKSNKVLPKNTVMADQHNMVFKGSAVVKGNGKALVTAIGQDTQIGHVTSLVESSEETATPLDKKLNKLTRKLIYITIVITGVFILSGFLQNKEWVLIIETSIALAVAAIPEGLPIVATIALASGMLLMARKNAIVKKLSSVETLGGTNVILTDKTGTLTENKIYVNTFVFPEETADATLDKNTISLHPGITEKSAQNYEELTTIAALCNNASIENIKGEVKETGDPLEVALLHLSSAAGKRDAAKTYPRISEEPFNSDTKTMGTVHKHNNGYYVAAKGSVEQLLEHCSSLLTNGEILPLGTDRKSAIIRNSDEMSEKGLRVLAFAYRTGSDIDPGQMMNELIYAGMIGFLDPPRTDIKGAILSCREAGIKVVMITGDHPKTALTIAGKTGLTDPGKGSVMTGGELPDDGIYSEEAKKKILSTSVFARVTPKQKLDIASIYQEDGHIVAMTGDGVNDAPALKKADVGIAMGLRGTQVAKETADIILKDDSFVSIAEAVSHGREIFLNIQKFVVYLISCNLSEIFVVSILGFVLPMSTLLPLQILFLNMVTDVFPALALGMGKGDELIMKRPPRNPQWDIITRGNWRSIFIYAAVLTTVTCSAVFYCNIYITDDPVVCNNVAFLSLAIGQLWHVLNMSSGRFRIKNEITSNKYIWMALILCFGMITIFLAVEPLRKILDLRPITFSVWLLCTVASITPLLIIQVIKSLELKGSKEIKP